MEEKKLERTKVLKIKGDDFIFDISKISVNDYLTITNEKIRITNGNYSSIATSPLISSFNSANIIDMIATFRVLKPEIEKSVEGEDFSKLNILDIKELLSIYVEEFSPWYSSWMNEFESPFIPEESEKGAGNEE